MSVFWSDIFNEYIKLQSESDCKLLQDFFDEFNCSCRFGLSAKSRLWEDFENAILYYSNEKTPLENTLKLLDITYMGDFYGKPTEMRFPLDDIAKLYPLSMERGRMSVFRLSAYLDEAIVPELLQMALNFTVKRFPTFASTLKKGVFWHYLDTTHQRYYIEDEKDIPCRPIKVSRSGSQTFRVIYYKNRISIELFHVLSDALGGVKFIKALVAEYLRLSGKDISLDETVFDVNDPPEMEEFENGFSKIPHKDFTMPTTAKKAVQIGGKLSSIRPCQIIHFRMNATELKAVSEKYNTSVTGYMIALMFVAAKASAKETKGYLNIQVPVNLRKYFPSKTVRNFAVLCGIGMSMDSINDPHEIIEEINQQLQRKTSKGAMEEVVAYTKKLITVLKYVPIIIKQPVVKLSYGTFGDKGYTSILSNLGIIKMPSSMAKHVKYMDAILGTTIIQRARCIMATINNTSTLTITKVTTGSIFEEKLYELICNDNITVMVEGSELYGD